MTALSTDIPNSPILPIDTYPDISYVVNDLRFTRLKIEATLQ